LECLRIEKNEAEKEVKFAIIIDGIIKRGRARGERIQVKD
jgi:hypothetical protein